MNFNGKRYTTWRDETLWSKSAREGGLVYGVYDNKLNRQCTYEEQGGRITSMEDARQKAIELNDKDDQMST